VAKLCCLHLHDMRPVCFFLCFFVFSTFSVKAENYVFNYTDACRNAYENFLSLKLEEGRADIYRAMKEDPYNLMATFVSDYEDCILLLFNGDKRDFQQRRGHMDIRLDLLSKADRNTPWYRFSKAGVYMHWALVYMRFGENFKAATAFRKSYLLLKENRKLYPSFEYNDVYLGLGETVVGVIPDDYKWIASIFGMRGDVKKGIARLNKFIASKADDDILRKEAVVYSLYLGFYLLHEQETTWKYINNAELFPIKDDLLNQFVYANIAINYRKAAKAISVLKGAEKNLLYPRYPIFDYEMGSALLNKTDSNSISYLFSFIKKFKGNIFIKDAWQKLYYAYSLSGNVKAANDCKKNILQYGTLMVDADKQAQRFAEGSQYTDEKLLAARLLVDGGYYAEAFKILGAYNEADFPNDISKLEYYFRMGRIYEELLKDNEAFAFYNKTISFGKNRKEYYAARAFLQMAFIYERRGNQQEALKKYKECLALKGHDFQNSIDQMAKAGINRLQ
jgi:hypothetical protein